MKEYSQVEIDWKPKKAKIAQVYNRGLEYAFVSKDWKQIHQLVYCKDFLQDAIFGFLTNQRISIYSFVYDPKIYEPIYLKKTRLLIVDWRDKTLPNKIEGCEDFLHQFEHKLKISEQTKVLSVKNVPAQYKKSGAWIFESSKRWQNSPPMISLYALLIRIGLSHKVGVNLENTIHDVINRKLTVNQSEDVGFLSVVRPTIEKLFTFSDSCFYKNIKLNYTSHTDYELAVYSMHNNCGICGFTYGNTEKFFPKWHKTPKVKEV